MNNEYPLELEFSFLTRPYHINEDNKQILKERANHPYKDLMKMRANDRIMDFYFYLLSLKITLPKDVIGDYLNLAFEE